MQRVFAYTIDIMNIMNNILFMMSMAYTRNGSASGIYIHCIKADVTTKPQISNKRCRTAPPLFYLEFRNDPIGVAN